MKEVRLHNETLQRVLAEHVQIADTLPTRIVGLLRHTYLEPGHGLLIVPCNSIHSFGMKFVFDAVFLSRKMKVVKLIEGMKPQRLSSISWTAHSVLELPEGAIRQSGVRLGDQIVEQNL